MKRHLEIIKGLGLFLLLFVLVSTAAASDSTSEVSVTITQSSSSGDDRNTVTNTYTTKSESPNIHVTGAISGNDASVIATEEDTESTDSDVAQPDFKLDGLTYEEFNDELSEWISSMLDEEDLPVTIDDFPQDVTDIINVE